MKQNFSKSIIILIAFFAIVFSSCSRSLGYSTLLWDVPEKNLQDGQILKVVFKSNIGHVYVVSLPNGKDHLEIPLWQLTSPSSKAKAEKNALRYQEYSHQYAKIKLDGLPVRAEPVNTAKQVYRLHKDEIVKILRKSKGQDVMTGKGQKLEGDWLEVLTTGGTRGWCFSYNLAIFETGEGGQIVGGELEAEKEEATGEDVDLARVLQSKWYPDTYLKMLKNNTIDLETIQTSYGFDMGAQNGKVIINVKNRYRSASYNGITKVRDRVYDFTGSPFQMTIKDAETIMINYTDIGEKPEVYTFVTLPEDVDLPKIVEDERRRRANELVRLYNVDSFKSSNYGTLVFNNGNTFAWNGYSLLVPEIVPSSARGRGKVSIKYLLSGKLKEQYDGVLSFHFENTSDDVSFLYKLDSNGLSLEDTTSSIIKDNIVLTKSTSSILIFFNR